MPLPLVVLYTGLAGVFIVMTLLLVLITWSSKLAIFIEKKQQSAE